MNDPTEKKHSNQSADRAGENPSWANNDQELVSRKTTPSDLSKGPTPSVSISTKQSSFFHGLDTVKRKSYNFIKNNAWELAAGTILAVGIILLCCSGGSPAAAIVGLLFVLGSFGALVIGRSCCASSTGCGM